MDFSSTEPWLRALAFAGITAGAALLCWWLFRGAGSQARQLFAGLGGLATVPATVAAGFEGGSLLDALAVVAVAGFVVCAAAVLGPELRRPLPLAPAAAPASAASPAPPRPPEHTRVAPASLATAVTPAAFAEQTISLGPAADVEAIAFLVDYSADGHPYRLGGDTVIGRESGVAITVDDVGVSREHARIKFEDGRFVLYDLGSTNGTRLVRAGRRRKVASPTPLMDLDMVEVGSSRLVFLSGELPPR